MKITQERTYTEIAGDVNLIETGNGDILVEVTDETTGLRQVVTVVRGSRDPGSEYGVEAFSPYHAFEVAPSD